MQNRTTVGIKAHVLNDPSISIGLAIIVLLLICAIFAPWISSYPPNMQNLTESLQPMSLAHPCGTDVLGRDTLSRLIHGSRITLLIVLLVAVLSAPTGLCIGMLAGYANSWVDRCLMRVTDIWLALPSFILALLIAALGPGIENLVVAIALTTWTSYARLIRSETLRIKNMDYIKAARLQGASHLLILYKHVLPMCLPILLVRTCLDISGIILTIAGLGFLGLGVQPPMPEWGTMLSTGKEFMMQQWWLITFPGIAIFITSMGFNLLGEGLRDFLDPRIE